MRTADVLLGRFRLMPSAAPPAEELARESRLHGAIAGEIPHPPLSPPLHLCLPTAESAFRNAAATKVNPSFDLSNVHTESISAPAGRRSMRITRV